MYDVLLSPPDVGEAEIEAVVAALRSGWVAPAGPDLLAFEQEAAKRFEVPFAVGLSSGTAALHLALVSWGVGPGDVVPVSTLTFAASVNAIRYVGAEPHLVDCDPLTGNMNPAILRAAVSGLVEGGRRVPVIVPVDMLGKCVDYDAIGAISSEFGARLLCDAAESVGATYRGRSAGSFGDASVLSFNGNKIMTTSGGGMLLTHDGALADHVRKLSTQAREPAEHYEHVEVGYNYRLSNILAALGRVQLSRLEEMMQRRRKVRDHYRGLFAETAGVSVLDGNDDHEDNCWLTALVIDPDAAGFSAQELAAVLKDAGIESRPIWKPMHQQPVYRGLGATLDGSADWLFQRGLTLPSGSGLTETQLSRIDQAVATLLTRRL